MTIRIIHHEDTKGTKKGRGKGPLIVRMNRDWEVEKKGGDLNHRGPVPGLSVAPQPRSV